MKAEFCDNCGGPSPDAANQLSLEVRYIPFEFCSDCAKKLEQEFLERRKKAWQVFVQSNKV